MNKDSILHFFSHSFKDPRLENYAAPIASFCSRLAQFIHHHYNCSLKFINFNDASPSTELLQSLMYKNQPIQLNQNVYLPLYQEELLMGAVEVTPQAPPLTALQISRLQQILPTLVEATLESLENLENLDKLEKTIYLGSQNELSANNIIPLESYRRKRSLPPLPNSFLSPRPKVAFTIPCLIEARCSKDILRMALELHDLSHRLAFVSLDALFVSTTDAPTSKITSSSAYSTELHSLENISVFIPEISNLDPSQQELLLHFFEQTRTKSSPQIISGTTQSYAELLKTPQINSKLLSHLRVAYLKMDQPFEEYKKYGVLDFFYDSLVGTN